MAGVVIQSFNAQLGGGGAGIDRFAYFADSFNRSDQPFFLGSFWQGMYPSAATGIAPATVAANINVSSGVCTISNGGTGSTVAQIGYSPLAIMPYWGKDQFAELVITAGNNAVENCRMQVNVFSDMNGGNWYGLVVHNNGLNACRWRLQRVTAGGGTTVTLHGPISGFTYPIKIRLEVTRSGGINTLTVYIDDVQAFQTTDNGIGGEGVAGFIGATLAIGATMSCRDFKCGTLPQIINDADYSQVLP